MSTVWSGWNGGLAVGIDVTQSPSTVTSSTSSVTLTWTIYGRNDSTHGTGSYTWSSSGAHSGSGSGSGGFPTWGTTWEVTHFTTTVTPSYSGTVSSSLTASLNWTSTGANPSLSRTYSIAKRPPSTPDGPTSVSAAISGSNVAVSWTRPSDASSAATIWSNVVIQRQTDVYSANGWSTKATLSGTTTSWSDTAATANHQFWYKVYATNVTGGSPQVNAPLWVPTAPAAPTGVTGKRSGSNIIISWTDNSPFNSSWKVEDSPDGTTWSTVATGVSASSTSYTHVSPSTSVTHRYRITAVTSNNLTGVSAVSNTVTLVSAPAAPSALAPAVIPTGGPGSFTWTHNPTDTSDQTAFEIQYSVDGGATWTDTGKVTSTVSTWSAAPVYATAHSVLWKVATWGAATTASPYSPTFTTLVSSRPTVVITAPTTTVTTSTATIQWSYSQAEGLAEASYVLTVTDPSGNVAATHSASTPDTTWTTPAVLLNSTTYTASVTVTSATAGLTATGTQTFTVTYNSPVAPTVVVDDEIADGYIGLAVTTTSNGTNPNAVSLMIERQIDSGAWLTLWHDTVTSITWADYGCSLTGVNTYRVTATSALPSSAQTIVAEQPTALQYQNVVILGTGVGLSDVLRFSNALTADLTTGRDVTLNQFAGRSFPVATRGVTMSCTVSVTARLVANPDPVEAVRAAVQAYFLGDGPFLYRDSLGRRFYCAPSSVTLPSSYPVEVPFTVTQVDPGTGVVEGISA